MASEEVLIQAVRSLRVVTNFDVAASSLFMTDYIMTLPLELDLVWRMRWNVMKVLYILQRYLPFFDTVGLVLYHQLKSSLDEAECRTLYYASGSLIVVGMTCSEVILTLRTWAMWSQDRRLTIFLPIAFALVWIPDFAFLAIFLRSLRFSPLPSPLVGCYVTRSDRILLLCWVVVLLWDALILGLMIIPGYRAFKVGGNTAFTRIIFRDGAFYYLYLFFLTGINIIIVIALPPQYSQLLTSTARCFHSMLTSRVLLHIRAHTSAAEPVFRQDDELVSLDLLRSQEGSRPTLIRSTRSR